MSTCLKISDAAALALHTVDYLVRNSERFVANQEIAAALSVSANHLAKVHQRLVHTGLVFAVRGPGGGFRLAKPAGEITLLSVMEAVDGPFTPSRCLLGRPECSRATCILGDLSADINERVRTFFTNTTVSQLSLDTPIL